MKRNSMLATAFPSIRIKSLAGYSSRVTVLAIALFIFHVESFAQQGTLTDNATFPTNFSTLEVQGAGANVGKGAAVSFVRFKLTPNLPPSTPGSAIGKATLTLYVGNLKSAGSLNVYRVTTSWKETDGAAPAYDAANPIATGVQVNTTNSYVTVDLTALAQQWLGSDGLGTGGLPNYGIALVANTTAAAFTFDSKEDTQTSHAPQLSIVLNRAATADNATSFTGPLAGDVTGPQSATVVSSVGGKSAAAVASATTTVYSATSSDTPGTIVRRDAAGNFSAGTISASLDGNATSATNAATANALSSSATVNGSQVNGALTNATIAGNSVTGSLPASQVNGDLTNATIAGNKVTSPVANATNATTATTASSLSANAIVPGSQISGDIAGRASSITGTVNANQVNGAVAEATHAINADNATNASNASSVTNGVYTVGDQTIGGSKTFVQPVLGSGGSFSGNTTAANSSVFTVTQSGSSSTPVTSPDLFPSAVLGMASATKGSVDGVAGISLSANGTGVFGRSPLNAIVGRADGTSGTGVIGFAASSTGSTIGVQGLALSNSGIAGLFKNLGGGQILSGQTGAGEKFKVDGSGNVFANGYFKLNGAPTGTGTVTSITAGSGLSGGTITTSGTLALDTNFTNSLYAAATGSPNYVAKAGDAMTGTLRLPANGLVAGTNQLALADGRIGIGTTSPSNALSVVGTADFSTAVQSPSFTALYGDGNSLALKANDSSAGDGGGVSLRAGDNITNNSGYNAGSIDLIAGGFSPPLYPTIRPTGASLGLGGAPGGSSYAGGSATLQGGNGWNNGQPIAGGSVILNAGSGGGSPAGVIRFQIGGTEHARVNNNGNVGIGTTTPAQKLSVAGTVESISGGFKFPDGTTQTTAASGTITGVAPGTGLSGGGNNGNVTLNVNQSVVAFQSDLSSETTARQSADTTLQNSFNSEASTRAAADAALQTSISGTVAKAGDTMTGTLTGPSFNAAQFTSRTAGESLTVKALDGTGNGGALTVSAGNAGVANGGGGGNLTLQAGSAVPQGGAGYSNQGSAGAVSITAGGGYNGVGGDVTVKSGPNSNWSLATNRFSKVSLQGGNLLTNDGAQVDVEGAHNGSSSNSPLTYGGNVRITAGNGNGGLAGGSITLTPGTGSPNGVVTVAGSINANGNVTATSSFTVAAGGTTLADAWTVRSSARFKQNVLTLQQALPKVLQLRGVTFNWKDTQRPSIGFIAEEVARVLPEAVEYETNGKDARGLDYNKLTPLLVEAIKAQQQKIEALQEQNAKLEQRNAEQAARLAALEEMVKAIMRRISTRPQR